MTLVPLLAAPLVIVVHAFAAMAAFALGLVQLLAPKGTLPHRRLTDQRDSVGGGALLNDFFGAHLRSE